MSRSKRVIAFAMAILAIFLFVGSPFDANVSALVGVDDALIAVIIAALAAIGIVIVTSGAYTSSQGMVADWMSDYAIANNTTVADQMKGVQVGSGRYGKLLVNNRFLTYIEGLAEYLKYRFGLSDNTTVSIVSPGLTVNGLTAYTLPLTFSGYYDYEYEFTLITSDVPVYAMSIYSAGALYPTLYLWSDQQAVVTRRSWNQYGQWTNQYTLTRWSGMALEYYSDTNTDIGAGSGLVQINYSDMYSALYDRPLDINNIGLQIDIEAGTIVLPSDDPDYTAGDGASIDVGANWGEGYRDITGETIPDAFSDGNVGEASIEYTGDSEVAGEVIDTPSQTISQELDDYAVSGIETVFPFCIPFDLYNFVSCLAAEPEAPKFTWRFYVPGICDEDIEIDLAPFDTVAQILRTLELLLFCVGLAFVTRKIIRG